MAGHQSHIFAHKSDSQREVQKLVLNYNIQSSRSLLAPNEGHYRDSCPFLASALEFRDQQNGAGMIMCLFCA